MDRTDDLLAAIARLRGDVDELQRLMASRVQPAGTGWGVPSGGYAEATASQAGITGVASLTSLAVTWTAVAGRRYDFHFGITALQNTAAGNVDLILADASNTVVWKQTMTVAAGSHTSIGGVKSITGIAAGSRTYRLRASTSAGTLTVNGAGGSTSSLLVVDVGPA